MRRMLMLDVCSGLGGASQAFVNAGWRVVTVDVDPRFNPEIVADIREWSWQSERPDFAWFSVPCPEFSRWSMPWTRKRNPPKPDMSLYNAAKRIIRECKPRYWVVENVRGAVEFFGPPRAIVGPFYLWGEFPPLGNVRLNMRKKESYSSQARAERAKIPYALSRAMLNAVQQHDMGLIVAALPLAPAERTEGETK